MFATIQPIRPDAGRRSPRSACSAAIALAMMATLTVATSAAAADASAHPAASPSAAPPSDGEPRFWSDVLSVGDCIIRPEEGVLPVPLSCDELHGEEIYAIGRLDLGPDAPYPGDAIFDMVDEQLCAKATIQFGGETWDLLPFTTYWLYPLESEWEAGDRGIMCSAAPPDGIAMKVGTAAGGSLDSDDVLLARGGFALPELGEISEWVAVREHDTISSVGVVTEGQFDVPRRRAWAVPQGFMFNATPRGDEAPATTTWGYAWETGDFTDLGSIFPGWELSSTMVMDGTTVFAARPTPDDDWDLFASLDGADAVAIADGPGDQQYPTFTPDGTQVIFHDDGDLVIIDIDGSNARVLDGRDGTAFESAVSPDGTLVAYASDDAGNDDIWLVGIDGGDPVNLTQHPANEAWPTWSADGTRIYFNTDRLRPENRVSSLMMMNADGSDPSWFSGASVGQSLVLDGSVVRDAVQALPTIDELYLYELVEGEPDTVTGWEHDSGRLSAELPVGWRVAPFDDGVGFLAAPSPSRYNEDWKADGIAVTLREDLSASDFFALLDETAAAGSCERLDGDDGIQAIDDSVDRRAADYACGDEGAVARVIGLYDSGAVAGVLIEAQRDDLPDAEADIKMLEAIVDSLAWG